MPDKERDSDKKAREFLEWMEEQRAKRADRDAERVRRTLEPLVKKVRG